MKLMTKEITKRFETVGKQDIPDPIERPAVCTHDGCEQVVARLDEDRHNREHFESCDSTRADELVGEARNFTETGEQISNSENPYWCADCHGDHADRNARGHEIEPAN